MADLREVSLREMSDGERIGSVTAYWIEYVTGKGWEYDTDGNE